MDLLTFPWVGSTASIRHFWAAADAAGRSLTCPLPAQRVHRGSRVKGGRRPSQRDALAPLTREGCTRRRRGPEIHARMGTQSRCSEIDPRKRHKSHFSSGKERSARREQTRKARTRRRNGALRIPDARHVLGRREANLGRSGRNALATNRTRPLRMRRAKVGGRCANGDTGPRTGSDPESRLRELAFVRDCLQAVND